MVNPTPDTAISYAGYRFPPEVISYAVWLYFRFPLSLRMVEEMLGARGIEVRMKRYASGRLSWVSRQPGESAPETASAS